MRSIPNDIRTSLAAPLGRLAGLDPFDILTKSNAVLEALHEAEAQVGAARRGAVRELRAQGFTLKQIADVVGVKPQRIHQLEEGYDRKEKRARKQA